jgi:hypothetical protein
MQRKKIMCLSLIHMPNILSKEKRIVKCYLHQLYAGEKTSHSFCLVIKLGSIPVDS